MVDDIDDNADCDDQRRKRDDNSWRYFRTRRSVGLVAYYSNNDAHTAAYDPENEETVAT